MRIICCQDDVLVFSLSSSFPIEQKRRRYSFAGKRRRRRRGCRRRRRRRRGTRAKHRVANIGDHRDFVDESAAAHRDRHRERLLVIELGAKIAVHDQVEPGADLGANGKITKAHVNSRGGQTKGNSAVTVLK